MKQLLLTSALLISFSAFAQKIENIIIITTDGFRWQEAFTGMDPAIANNPAYNQGDSAGIFKKYWSPKPETRRSLLLPFLWNTVGTKGQFYGNRKHNNMVSNANPYWFSYPGYSEIFTGYPDTAVNSNGYKPNPHTNLLEFLNKQPSYQGKVAAFGAWDAFDRILNEGRSKVPVYSAFDKLGGTRPSDAEKLISDMSAQSYKPFGEEECLDVFTHYAAMNYLQTKKPKVLYIAYGETDEWAHSGRYKDYLNAAHQVDQWIEDIWNYIQSDPFYKNRTALFITVDHGRGDLNKNEWRDHGSDIKDAYQIWFAVMGPGVKSKGEVRTNQQLYQKQFAQTIAALLGLNFTAEHPIGEKIELNRD